MIDNIVNKYITEAKGSSFSTEQLEKLRKDYGSIEKIDPTAPTYKKLEKFIDGLDVDQLKGIAFAKIKWLSMLAANKLRYKHNIKLKPEQYWAS